MFDSDIYNFNAAKLSITLIPNLKKNNAMLKLVKTISAKKKIIIVYTSIK